MKNGIFTENGQKIYYKDGHPYHAGVVKIEGDIYYIGRHGKVATGQHIVHGEMSNGILKRGTYTFSEEGKLIKGTFIPPKTKRRRHSGSKNKNKKSFWKRINKKTFGLCAGLIALFIVLIVVSVISDMEKREAFQEDNDVKVTVTLPDFKEPVSLCSKAAEMLYRGECTFEQVKGDKPYKALEFDYMLSGADGELTLSEYPDLRNGKKYILSQDEEKLNVDNLKTGCTYYYEVTVGEESYMGSFSTEEGRRYINIPGAVNTRDIGGYVNREGKTLRQGMIIRGSELDGLTEPDFYLAKTDAEKVLNELSFVYDLDLRSPAVSNDKYISKLGSEVEHKFYNAPMYAGIFSESNEDSLRSIFRDLSDVGNYPMYMHCSKGSDRTGTIIFLLQGLLGMSDEDIMSEYQLTTFIDSSFAEPVRITAVIDGLEAYEGDTLSERITDFLINEIGVTEKEIEAIRNILLEG